MKKKPPEPGKFWPLEPEPTIQQRFDAWMLTEDGQTVYDECHARAMKLRNRGWKHGGIGMIWESIRYDQAIKVGPDADGYKLQDHYRSRIARRLMDEHEELDGFFEIRELRA